MQNFLIALSLPLLIQPIQLAKTDELPMTEAAAVACVVTWQVPCACRAPNGKPYYGPAC
ncbi:hypothetical protein MNNICLKF_00727 [Synechococcus sp. CBW1107]|jgi:hypothetical protein|nr:hypothetical protein MNNICLKF_00727 [Synechococcus sp. CBW1107]